jgi:hypothetical protein
MVGAQALELVGQAGDLAVELVYQLQTGVDRPPPWIGDGQAVKQLTAAHPEQV